MSPPCRNLSSCDWSCTTRSYLNIRCWRVSALILSNSNQLLGIKLSDVFSNYSYYYVYLSEDSFMIDWVKTSEVYGYSSLEELVGVKRPLVVCKCDGCGKERSIQIRVKTRVVDGQLAWRCPSCVCLSSSSTISANMERLWDDGEYRESQITRKEAPEYREIQSIKSKMRWADEEYRAKLATGLNVEEFLKSAELASKSLVVDVSSLVDWKTKIVVNCLKCGKSFSRLPQHHLMYASCPFCKLPSGLLDLVDSDTVVNDRSVIKPLELDLYWPKFNLALEYHGLYWHSSGLGEAEDRFRHQDKAFACVGVGVKLLQFFDFEWKYNSGLILSMINHAMGKSERVMARRLKCVKLSNGDVVDFLNTNHLQGFRPAKFTTGLSDGSRLFMVTSFSRCGDGFELIRMATAAGYCVVGGAGRLLRNFSRRVGKRIYTFADMRYSVANAYRKVGFEFLSVTDPGYFYYKGGEILSRYQCQKNKLGSVLGDQFDPELSETVNMFRAGYRRVWDAGNVKLVLPVEGGVHESS